MRTHKMAAALIGVIGILTACLAEVVISQWASPDVAPVTPHQMFPGGPDVLATAPAPTPSPSGPPPTPSPVAPEPQPQAPSPIVVPVSTPTPTPAPTARPCPQRGICHAISVQRAPAAGLFPHPNGEPGRPASASTRRR